MEIAPPQSAGGRLWHDQFNSAYQAWIQSGFHDDDALLRLTRALRFTFEREPPCAAFVATMAASLGFQHTDQMPPATLRELAVIGVTAVASAADDADARVLRAWLLADRGRAALAQGDEAEARAAADEAWALLDAADDHGTDIGQFAVARAIAVRAAARERSLDMVAAGKDYRQVEELVAPLVEDVTRLESVVAQVAALFLLTDLADGPLPEEAAAAYLTLVHRAVARLRIDTGMSTARVCALLEVDVDQAALSAGTVVQTHGVAGVDSLDVALVTDRASPTVAETFSRTVIATAEALGVDAAPYQALCDAVAASVAQSPDASSALTDRSLQSLAGVADTFVRAATLGYLFLAAEAHKAAVKEQLERAFLEHLGALDRALDPRLDDPRRRAVLDRAVCALSHSTLVALREAPDDADAQTRACRVLDLSLGRTTLDSWMPQTQDVELEGLLGAAWQLTQDWLGRLEIAVAERRGTVAVVVRSAPDSRTNFVLCTSEGFSVWSADAAYADAAGALVALTRSDTDDAVSFGRDPSPADVYREHGQTLWNALPPAVAAGIADADVVLLALDPFDSRAPVPFELIHDGASWLGTRASVARFPSVAALVASAEGTTRRDTNRRALLISVPEVPERPDLAVLSNAVEETSRVRRWFAADGWDAPEIEPDRVDPAFVLDRLPFVTHLHVAAHGEANAREECLVLRAGSRLTASDMRVAYVPRAPTAYINACWLGVSRYIGGGVSRGIAAALLSAGSAAVVANLLPVDDEASVLLAVAFYDAADRGFGNALAVARSKLAENGASPWSWASTVLFGDPWVGLRDASSQPRLGQLLLDTMIDTEVDTAAASVLRDRAGERLATEPPDLHLLASSALLQALSSLPAPNVETRPQIAAACRIAERLGASRGLAVLIYLLTETYTDADDTEELAVVLDGAITHLESVSYRDRGIEDITSRLLSRWMRLLQGEQTPRMVVQGATGQEADELQTIGDHIADIQLAAEARALRRGGALARRTLVRTEDDVTMNAVLARRDFNLEDIEGTQAIASRVKDELVWVGALDIEATDEPSTCLAGLLQWLWDQQNLVSLVPEVIEGQANTLHERVARLAHLGGVVPRWLDVMARFESELEQLLTQIDELPYDDRLYVHINALPDQVTSLARHAVDQVMEHFADDVPVAGAWVIGYLIARNTYSWRDGSVPESIHDRLEAARSALAADAEGWFMPLLMAGFESVRSRVPDELDRWRG